MTTANALPTPPTGYTLPAIAVNLISHATAHGWLTGVQWQTSSSDEPYVTVHVGRKLVAGELDYHRGDNWYYQLTWHSRDCAPGRVRLFRAGLARTPLHPQWHDAPSVKGVRTVIETHPAPAKPGGV